jgi:DNA invertase Pin-like site-specific DNA recombinase
MEHDDSNVKVGIYGRSAVRDWTEIKQQIVAAMDWCASNLSQAELSLAAFIDNGYSGAAGWTPDAAGKWRPGLAKLHALTAERQIDVLVAPTPCCLSRSWCQFLELADHFRDHNVKVVFLNGPDIESCCPVGDDEFEDEFDDEF